VRRVRIWIRPLLFGPLIFFSSSVLSQQPDSGQTIAIPAFLDLATALEIAESSGYPGLDIAESKILASTAELAEVKSTYGLRSGIELDPRYVYSVDPGDETTINDSYYRIGINKLISDFGYTDKLSTAAEAEILARANEFVESRYRHRLKIIGAYMDVLLTDRRYDVDNETMTLRYLKFDKARDRHELGEVSDVDLLGLESAYRNALITRARTANRQSQARAELAALLNHPDDFPAELEPIRDLADEEFMAPDYDVLLKQALELNPELIAQQKDVDALLAEVDASKLQNRPKLDSELELGNYERRYGEGLKWRVGLNFNLPLLQGGRDKAETARLTAELMEAQAQLKLMRNAMRNNVLQLVQEIDALKVARQASITELEYRDMYLDRSRSRYDLEIQTDLGDAAKNMAEAQWRADKVNYALMLAMARMDALLGRDPARFLVGQQ
jgi:outer membrane protein TolC